jgi:uncharacterized membrane protein
MQERAASTAGGDSVHDTTAAPLVRSVALPPVADLERVEQPAPWPIPVGLAAVAFAAYAVLSISTYERYADPSWDLAIFTQAVGRYGHLAAPIVTLKGPGFDILGDHFSPILAVLAPFYRLFPSPVTLQAAQALLLAAAVVPVTRTAMRLLGNASGTAVGVAYVLAWGIQTAVAADFHEVAFAVPLVAFALEAALLHRWNRVVAWAALLPLVKEDLGVTVAVLGLYLVWRGARRQGVALVIYGSVATALTIGVVMPALNPSHHYAYLSTLPHAGAHGGLWHAVTLGGREKLHTLALLVAVTGLAALRSPLALLAVPTLAWRFVAVNPTYWGTAWHYSAVLMPIAFLAAVDGLSAARRSGRPLVRGYARAAPAVVLVVALALLPGFPLRDLAHRSTYAPGPRGAAAARAVASIPRGAVVESDNGLLSRLVARDRVYWIGDTGSVVPGYVVLDSEAGWSPQAPPDVAAYADGLHPGRRYQVVFDAGGYQVARLTTADGPGTGAAGPGDAPNR